MSDLQPGLGPQVECWTKLLLDQGWCVIPSTSGCSTIFFASGERASSRPNLLVRAP